MQFDYCSLNKNTQIKFVSKSDVELALDKTVDIESIESRGSSYVVGDSESSISSDSDIVDEGRTENVSKVEENKASSASKVVLVSKEPDGMDMFVPESDRDNDSDDELGCSIS